VAVSSPTRRLRFTGSVAWNFAVPAIHESESERRAAEVDTAIERCRAEIVGIEALLLAGHPDVHGICMALSDWSAELSLLESGLRW